MSVATVLYLEILGDIMGGGQRSLVDIVTRLDPRRFRPVVVCGWQGTLAAHLTARGITTHALPLPTLKYPWQRGVREGITRLTQIIAQEQVALIHANQLRWALYGLQAARRRVPVIFHARVPRYRLVPDRWMDQHLARRCAAVIAVSQAVAARFPWIAGTPRLRVIYNALDLEALPASVDRGALRRRYGIPDEAPLIGAVGLLEPRRGYDVLLQAFATVHAQHPAAHLLIAGRDALDYPGYSEHLRRLAVRYGVANHVTLTGFLEDIPSVMGALDMCAMPGVKAEGFGRVVIEAGAMRCPVVATPLGGFRELVQDGVTGLLVPPRDPAALAAALERLVNEPALVQRLGAAARQQVETQFALPVMMQRLHEVYEEVLGAPALVA